jgi:hypothetical protein
MTLIILMMAMMREPKAKVPRWYLHKHIIMEVPS